MSLDDVLGRIQQLQALIDPAATTADSSGATATTADGQDFSSALASATGTGATTTPQAAAPTSGPYGGTATGLYAKALGGTALGAPTDTNSVTGSAGLPTGTPVTGADIVTDSLKYLGVPYKWGGTNPSTGLDCSGLVQRVFADKGVSLPRVSAEQATVGTEVPGGLANAQPGDLVFFGSPVHHVGIYAGNNTMVEAPHTGTKVQVHTIDQTPTHVRRIALPAAAGTVGSAGGSTNATLSALAAEDPATALDKLGVPASLRTVLTAAAQSQGLPVSLLAAVAKVESGFDPTSVSSAGAQGLMQLMPDTAAGLGANPWDPMSAATGAAKLLRGYLDKYNSVPLALAAYNAGPGAVAKYNGIPPYAETQAYVQRVGALAAAA